MRVHAHRHRYEWKSKTVHRCQRLPERRFVYAVSKTMALCIYLFFVFIAGPAGAAIVAVKFFWNFGLLTLRVSSNLTHTQKAMGKFPAQFLLFVKILRQKWEILPWAAAMCASTRNDAEVECGTRYETKAKESIPNVIPIECGIVERNETQWKSTKCSLMQKFFFPEANTKQPRQRRRQKKEEKKRKENCNCKCSNVAQQMNGTHGRRKYFQMEKLQHSNLLELDTLAPSVRFALQRETERKMHLRGCKARSNEREINFRHPSPASTHLIVFFHSLILTAAPAGRYGRHTMRTQSHVIIVEVDSGRSLSVCVRAPCIYECGIEMAMCCRVFVDLHVTRHRVSFTSMPTFH